MNSDSQHKQDLWVLNQLNNHINGFFVDIGAGEPWELSNTWLLETNFNWNGVCIEGDDIFFEKLKAERKCKCVHAYVASSANPTNINVTGREGKGYGNYLDGYGIVPSKYKKPVKPRLIMDILKECNVPQIIDYLSIDIEGAELDVLKTIDFNYYTFRTMTVEKNSGTQIIDFLTRKGYTFIENIGADDYGFVYAGQI